MPELTRSPPPASAATTAHLLLCCAVLCAMPCCGRSAVMLREGRLPGRSFQRLLSGEQEQLAGFVMGESLEAC